MSFKVINSATGETVTEISEWDSSQLESALAAVAEVSPVWRKTPMTERCALIRKAADVLRQNKDKYASIVTQEMGKLINDARAEVEKSASVCDFYADNGSTFLAEQIIRLAWPTNNPAPKRHRVHVIHRVLPDLQYVLR